MEKKRERKQPDRQRRRKERKGKQLGPKTAMHHSSGTKLNSNCKIHSAEKAPGGMGRGKKEERDNTQRRFQRDETDFIPYEYPKDSEMEQHFALI